MALEVVDRVPQSSDFTPLTEHEAQTPGTFFGGRAVLHLHAPAAQLKIPSQDFAAQADIRKLAGNEPPAPDANGAVPIDNIDIWVTSRFLILSAPTRSTGLQIPYPAISVTAQDGADVLLELNLSDPDTADEDIEFMQLRIAPRTVTAATAAAAAAAATDDSAQTNGAEAAGHTSAAAAAAQALFKAISNCQELNPDPLRDSEDDDEGGDDGEGDDAGFFDETAPGATGWITSENMGDFMDEHGNFRMPAAVAVVGQDGWGANGSSGAEEALGTGAGRTRTAAELDASDDIVSESDESKWQRTG